MSEKIKEIKKDMEAAYNNLVETLECSVIPDHTQAVLSLVKALKSQVDFLDKRVEALTIIVEYIMKTLEKEEKCMRDALERM